MTEEILAHPWFGTWLAAFVGVPLALLIHRVGGLVLMRVTRPTPALHAMVVNCKAMARLVLPLVALLLVFQAAPDNLRFIGSVRHFNGLLLIGATTWLLVKAINGFADGVLAQHPHDIEDNLHARRVLTQTRVLARTAITMVLVAGGAMMLMTFPGARQVGASLLASAGVIGIVAGLAAKPVFSNLIAGLQIALAQPIRMDDVLVVEGEWGRVEEITGTFVVVRIWDDRRLILPLSYFIEKPFQNWTRKSSQLLGAVFVYVDYGMPVAPLRAEVERIVKGAPEWDGRFFNLQVTDATERTMQIRVLCTAGNSSLAFDLRCKVREGLIDFMQREYPQFLPKMRIEGDAMQPASAAPSLAQDAAPPR
ncbi:mechanosensitive ion channel protein MscS [Variovorax sp. Root318D1]|uniref:mechanosensitive ion channel family protein n=1 Tax=Variovorax sp. Root318D1 TaxID=1736513 RepID=UPI0006F9C0E7|nr:mechanosensitive ion channel domain-containing protein [Variovorax sp. Root318D1]KQU88707.1 mechanosensitive ion channel protein MscS [Variovorax sp. Root318D1]